MADLPFTVEEEAVRDQVWLRGFLMGPTGSGKTKGALELASRIFGGELGVTLINTERGRGKMYADRYRFAYIDLSQAGDFSPEAYVRAIDYAEAHFPGRTLIIDSVSHEWVGANGILQQADRFGDWKTVRPKHNAWVERLLAYNGHLIVTCRAKMKYEVGEEESGGRTKQVIRMLGVGPVQSDDLQYEFNLVGRFEQETHDVTFSGHVDPLIDTGTNLGDEGIAGEIATILTSWLSEGLRVEPPVEADPEAVEELLKSLRRERELGNARLTEAAIEETFAKARRLNRGVVHPDWVAEKTAESQARVAEAERKAEERAAAAAAAGEQPALEEATA